MTTDTPVPTKPLVVVVDDEESILKALKRCLRRAGVRVEMANGGEAALELLRKETPAVLICDQRMPGMSGSEVLARSVELCPDTYRVTLTGYTDLESAQMSINEGQVDQFLTKPLRATREAPAQAAQRAPSP